MYHAETPSLPPISPLRTSHHIPSIDWVASPLMIFDRRPFPFSNAFTTRLGDEFFREMGFSNSAIRSAEEVPPLQTIDPRCLMREDDAETVYDGEYDEMDALGAAMEDGDTEEDGDEEMTNASSVSSWNGSTAASEFGTTTPSSLKQNDEGTIHEPNLSPTLNPSFHLTTSPNSYGSLQRQPSSHPVFFTANTPFEWSHMAGGKVRPSSYPSTPTNSPPSKEVWSPALDDGTPFSSNFLPSPISAIIPTPTPSQTALFQPPQMHQRDSPSDYYERSRGKPATLYNPYTQSKWVSMDLSNATNPTRPISPSVSPFPPLSISSDSDKSPPTSRPSSTQHLSPAPPTHPLCPSPTTTNAMSPQPTITEGSESSGLSPVPSDFVGLTPPVYDSITVVSTPSPVPLPSPPPLKRLRVLQHTREVRLRNYDDAINLPRHRDKTEKRMTAGADPRLAGQMGIPRPSRRSS